MKNSRASERYAKSLLQLSIDKDLVEEIKSDIDWKEAIPSDI